jgi:hypothetical protein
LWVVGGATDLRSETVPPIVFDPWFTVMPPSPFDPRAGFFEHAALAALRLAGCQSQNVETAGGRIHVLSAKGEGPGAPVCCCTASPPPACTTAC